MDQRHEWFREGARALRSVLHRQGRAHLLPSDVDLYPCPLCLDGLYGIDAVDTGELTREHVPPHSLGGRSLALTCRACNNDSGTLYDAEAEKQQRLRSFLAGRHQGAVRGTYTVNGVSHRGDIHLTPGHGDGLAPITFVGADAKEGDPVIMAATNTGVALYFQSITKINNPPEAARFDQALGDAVDNQRLDLSVEPKVRFSAERARVSWVRSGYLAAFAALGWTYILQESLAQVRDQLQARERAAFPEITRYEPGADPDRREILLVTEPSDCASVLIAIGAHLLFLPPAGKPCSLSDLANALRVRYQHTRDSQTVVTFTGIAISWPARPQYAADLLPHSRTARPH